MNCRVKTLYVALMRLTVLAIVLAVGLDLMASSANNKSIKYTDKYSNIDHTPKLSMYPTWIYNQMIATKGWSPSPTMTEQCKLSFSSPHLKPENCEANYNLSYWETFLSKIYVAFDVSDQNKFQRVQFEPQSGLKIRALLGLQKKDGIIQNKPLVILRMGIYGNIDEILAERFLARIAYEDLDYHVLIVESLTSHGYLTLNSEYTIGGIEEGLHTFYIVNLISHNQIEWAKNVSQIYLMGISLAGPGVFVVNYLDENSFVNGKKKTPSVSAIELYCPLVNFDETYKQHAKPGLFSAFADVWNWRRLTALREKEKALDSIPWYLTLLDLTPRFMPAVLDQLSEKRGKPIFKLDNFNQFPDLKLPQEFIDHINQSKNLHELNSFWTFYKNINTPIQIYLTPNDPLVMNQLNGEMIRNKKQPGEFNKVSFTDLKGLHCALAAEYQWPFLVELARRGFEVKH